MISLQYLFVFLLTLKLYMTWSHNLMFEGKYFRNLNSVFYLYLFIENFENQVFLLKLTQLNKVEIEVWL